MHRESWNFFSQNHAIFLEHHSFNQTVFMWARLFYCPPINRIGFCLNKNLCCVNLKIKSSSFYLSFEYIYIFIEREGKWLFVSHRTMIKHALCLNLMHYLILLSSSSATQWIWFWNIITVSEEVHSDKAVSAILSRIVILIVMNWFW